MGSGRRGLARREREREGEAADERRRGGVLPLEQRKRDERCGGGDVRPFECTC